MGAGVLGGGFALLFAEILKAYALAILIVGLAMHAWGMYQKHGLEGQDTAVRLWWAEAFYWFCWLALAALLLVIVVRR